MKKLLDDEHDRLTNSSASSAALTLHGTSRGQMASRNDYKSALNTQLELLAEKFRKLQKEDEQYTSATHTTHIHIHKEPEA